MLKKELVIIWGIWMCLSYFRAEYPVFVFFSIQSTSQCPDNHHVFCEP